MTAPTPFDLIRSALNHLLAQEPWARKRLAAHSGKIARFDAAVLALNLKVVADGVLAPAPDGAPPQVTIRVNAGDIPLLLQNRGRAFSYVTVEGDADFAHAISQIGQSLKWDAEQDLSQLVGDIAAVKLLAGAKAAARTAGSLPRKLAEQVAEYLLEETAMLVRPQAVIDLGGDVAGLRDDAERLGKRVEKLEGRIR